MGAINEDLNARVKAQQELITSQAQHMIEVQKAQITARAEAELARIDQMATAQKAQVQQRKLMMDNQVTQRATQLGAYSNMHNTLVKSLKDMPLGPYGFGGGFGGRFY